jgi:lipopolysaccharide transport system permease protein
MNYFLPFFIQIWFWLTPIIYPFDALPDSVKIIVKLNPMFYIISNLQKIIQNELLIVNPDHSLGT